jgi:hypothetical protein
MPAFERGDTECPMKCTYAASGSAYEEYPRLLTYFDSRTGEALVRVNRGKVSHLSSFSMSVTCESILSNSTDREASFDYTVQMYDECYDT